MGGKLSVNEMAGIGTGGSRPQGSGLRSTRMCRRPALFARFHFTFDVGTNDSFAYFDKLTPPSHLADVLANFDYLRMGWPRLPLPVQASR